MDDTPMLIWDWDMQVPYALAVDDEFITKLGAFPQPAGRTSALAGFQFVSRIFHLLGVVLSALRARRNPHPNAELADLLSLPRYVLSSRYTQVLDDILADLPPELQLKVERNPRPGQGSEEHTAFEICRVNILITQAMTRQAIQQYAQALGEEDAELHPSPRKLVIDMLETMPTESLTANGDSLVSRPLG